MIVALLSAPTLGAVHNNRPHGQALATIELEGVPHGDLHNILTG